MHAVFGSGCRGVKKVIFSEQSNLPETIRKCGFSPIPSKNTIKEQARFHRSATQEKLSSKKHVIFPKIMPPFAVCYQKIRQMK